MTMTAEKWITLSASFSHARSIKGSVRALLLVASFAGGLAFGEAAVAMGLL